MYTWKMLLSVLTVVFAGSAQAQSSSDDLSTVAPASAHSQTHSLGVEVDLVQPFVPTVNIIKPKFSWTVWGAPEGLRGTVLAALYLRPHIAHDVVETIDEYMLGLGYRQYFWRGLHLEVLLEGGVAWGINRVNHLRYTTPTLFLEVNAGYRFGFFEPGGFFYNGTQRVGFFVSPQLGTIVSLGLADIGPRQGKPDWFVQGNLLVGMSF